MITIKQTAEKAINLGKQLQAVIDVGEVLEEIGNLDNARIEAERDKQTAIVAKKKAEKELSKIEDCLAVVKNDYRNTQKQIKDQIVEGTSRHDHMIAEARKESDALVTNATQNSEELVVKATQVVNNLQDKRDKLLKEITNAQDRVSNLENQMRGLRERLG